MVYLEEDGEKVKMVVNRRENKWEMGGSDDEGDWEDGQDGGRGRGDGMPSWRSREVLRDQRGKLPDDQEESLSLGRQIGHLREFQLIREEVWSKGECRRAGGYSTETSWRRPLLGWELAGK